MANGSEIHDAKQFISTELRSAEAGTKGGGLSAGPAFENELSIGEVRDRGVKLIRGENGDITVVTKNPRIIDSHLSEIWGATVSEDGIVIPKKSISDLPDSLMSLGTEKISPCTSK